MIHPGHRTARSFSPVNVLIVLALLATGCSGVTREELRVQPLSPDDAGRPLAMDGARIGLLADARLQTARSMGTESADGKRVTHVELRPPALGYLAPDLLAHFLEKLADEQRVDLVVFLGNAANNGCEDELRRAFDILRDFRNRRNVPVFFVIGNHDYLGAGYTPDVSRRSLLCDASNTALEGQVNKPVGKFELITMVHEFNTGNFSAANAAQMRGWSYTHNFDRERVKQACIVNDPLRDQHVKAGCYYAAKLVHRDGSEILLTDTSDYHHEVEMSMFDIPSSKNKWYGLTGWISARNGAPECGEPGDHIVPQVRWFECHQSEDAPPVRMIAGHYPVKSLSPIGRKVNRFSRLLCHLSSLMLPAARSGDYWLSADTHLQPYLIRETVDVSNCDYYPQPRLSLSSLNIGSMVDYDWSPVLGKNVGYEATPDMAYAVDHEPHAVAASFPLEDGGRPVVDKVITNVNRCDEVLHVLRSQPTAESPVYTPVMDSTDYEKLFGLGKSHKQPEWTHYDHLNSRRNLEKLLAHLAGRFADTPGMSGAGIKACIALESARLAGSLQTRDFECETCPPWRIMRRIEEEKSAHY